MTTINAMILIGAGLAGGVFAFIFHEFIAAIVYTIGTIITLPFREKS